MKWRFTYKEFSLLLGILVAVIIMLTLWLKPFEQQSSIIPHKSIPLVIEPAAKLLLQKVALTIQVR